MGEEETEDRSSPRGETSKPGSRFHEIGHRCHRSALHSTHAQVVSLEQPLRLIQTALMFLSVEIPGLLSDRGLQGKKKHSRYCNPEQCLYIF